jgi:Protein of unknown function (DUF2889)
LLHHRTYDVRSYRQSDEELRIRGEVKDQKPAGMYIEGDPEPLTIHHMIVDLVVAYPSLVITAAEVVMETHPHAECPRITPHYSNLVGLSVTRGFTHKVRELFGRPRGCTHTTALLQAMAPVAVQSIWPMRVLGDGSQPVDPPLGPSATPEQIRERMAFNINTCHVWTEDGEVLQRLAETGEMAPPLWVVNRYRELGRDLADWRPTMG